MDKDKYFRAINDHTRATYYLLPLLDMGKASFCGGFITAQVHKTRSELRVALNFPGENAREDYWLDHPDWLRTEGKVLYYDLGRWEREVYLFRQGLWSKYSRDAKDLIYLNSGLSYMREVDGRTVTDARLKALTKDAGLRSALEEMLGLVIPAKSELISPPSLLEYYED